MLILVMEDEIDWKTIEIETKNKIKQIISSNESISKKMGYLNRYCWDAFDLFTDHKQVIMDDALDDAIMIFIDDSKFEETEKSRYNKLEMLVNQFS
jgi:hypothetical protein